MMYKKIDFIEGVAGYKTDCDWNWVAETNKADTLLYLSNTGIKGKFIYKLTPEICRDRKFYKLKPYPAPILAYIFCLMTQFLRYRTKIRKKKGENFF